MRKSALLGGVVLSISISSIRMQGKRPLSGGNNCLKKEKAAASCRTPNVAFYSRRPSPRSGLDVNNLLRHHS
jgi:hypothetical protein